MMGPEPMDDVWCESSTVYATMHDEASCGAQGLQQEEEEKKKTRIGKI